MIEAIIWKLTSNRLGRPDRLEIFGNNCDDPDDHMETRLWQIKNPNRQEADQLAKYERSRGIEGSQNQT